jgi:hypothetical protein
MQAKYLRPLIVGFAGLALLGGCSGREVFVYTSDAHSPKTVTLVDTTTGETIMTTLVPVGQQLNLRFEKDPLEAERSGSDRLAYSLRPLGDVSVSKGTSITVPPPTSRRIDVTLRPGPEARPPESSNRTSVVPTGSN